MKLPNEVFGVALICAINSSSIAIALFLNHIAQLEGVGGVEVRPRRSMGLEGSLTQEGKGAKNGFA